MQKRYHFTGVYTVLAVTDLVTDSMHTLRERYSIRRKNKIERAQEDNCM